MSTSSESSSQRAAAGPHFLAIEGLPMRYTWQDLKDLIRRQASHNCWTEMAVLSNGQSGGKGHARVARADEATRLFKFLTENRVENRILSVHLWDISSTPAVFTHCNCGPAPKFHPRNDEHTRISAMVTHPGWQSLTPPSPLINMRPSYSTVPAQSSRGAYSSPMTALRATQSMGMPVNVTQMTGAMNQTQLNSRNASQMTQYQTQGYQQRQTQSYQQPQSQQHFNSQIPFYAANSTGTPINISQGVVRTECRGIFVGGLDYKASTKDIEKHFGRAGEITKIDLQRDSQTGRSKGNCTIQYANAASAASAIEMFNGRNFKSMRLTVRQDKEATAINAPPAGNARSSQASRATAEPIIVNGSQVRQSSIAY